MPKFFFVIIFTILSIICNGQDLQTISKDVAAENIFARLTTNYKSSPILAEDIFADSSASLRIETEFFCIDNNCWRINSPIYFLKMNDEINFSFRLTNGHICILYLIDNILQTIEIFEPANKVYIQYLNLKEDF